MEWVSLWRVGLSLLLFQLVTLWAQEMLCSNPSILYSTMIFTFEPTPVRSLICSISNPTWWASSDPCGPFNHSSLCSEGLSLCNFDVTQIGDSFYHCCTSGGPVEQSLQELQGNCVHVQICTSLASHSSPPIGVYGETLLLYVEVYAHPPPNQTNTIHFLDGIIEDTRVSVFQKSRLFPLLTYEYAIPLPPEEEAGVQAGGEGDNELLLFFTSFEERRESCSRGASLRVTIPVLSSPGSTGGGRGTISPTTFDGVSIPPTGSIRLMDECTLNYGFLAGLVVALVFLVVLGVVLVVVLVYLVRFKRQHQSVTLAHSSSAPADPSRPNSLHMQYLRLQSTDHTPSPAQTPFPPEAHHNGTHPLSSQRPLPSTNGQMLATPPTRPHPSSSPPSVVPPPPATHSPPVPSSLALGVVHSHSGTTPLIAGSPEQHPPFPVPSGSLPPYTQDPTSNPPHPVTTTIQEVSDGHYAMVVGGASGCGMSRSEGGAGAGEGVASGGEPIYNNAVIGRLAGDVELTGVDSTQHTDV